MTCAFLSIFNLSNVSAGNPEQLQQASPSGLQTLEMTLIDPENDVTLINSTTGLVIGENLVMPDFDILNATITTNETDYTIRMFINGHFNYSVTGWPCYDVSVGYHYYWSSCYNPDEGHAGVDPTCVYGFDLMQDYRFNYAGQVVNNETGMLLGAFPRWWINDTGGCFQSVTNFWLRGSIIHYPTSTSYYNDTLANANAPGSGDSGGSDDNDYTGDTDQTLPGFDSFLLICMISGGTFAIMWLNQMRKRYEH